jgi:pimeloyl-ACP methyl ester carboxylesterase
MAYPPILFIHGEATGAWLWDKWRKHLRPFGWDTNVLDLRGHGRSLPIDFSTVTMEAYLADVESVTAQLAARSREPVLAGWGMGGMLAMMSARDRGSTPALVLVAPSLPLEIGGRLPASVQRQTPLGAIGPDAFGVFGDDAERTRLSMPELSKGELEELMGNCAGAEESGVALRQRQAGISVPAGSAGCSVLVVYGDTVGEESDGAKRLAEHLGGVSYGAAGASRWGLVYHEPAVAEAALKVDSWLRRAVSR